MTTRSIKLPDIGEGIAEAEVVEWSVKVGDFVREDQVVAAVMTDKATVEIPVPLAGTVLALGAEVGSNLAIGAELIRLEVAETEMAAASVAVSDVGEASSSRRSAISAPVHAAPVNAPARRAPVTPVSRAEVPVHATPATAPPGRPRPAASNDRPLASPSIRRQAQERGIDLRQIRGSGPAGRIRHEDLETGKSNESGRDGRGRHADTTVDEIKVVGMRRRIAQNMAVACRRVAHFSYIEEVDVTELENLRTSLNAAPSDRRPKLTPLPFLMLALTRAIRDFPQMNALYDDDADIIRRHGGVHIGIATQTDTGLLVPVVRHAETMGLFDYAREIARLSQSTRNGSAKRDELSGSTITITSLGALGGLATTPVVNRPEVAIIGVNKIAVRPVWDGRAFTPRKMMNLSSSFDHRVIDGHAAASFIQRIRTLLESPAMLFIEG